MVVQRPHVTGDFWELRCTLRSVFSQLLVYLRTSIVFTSILGISGPSSHGGSRWFESSAARWTYIAGPPSGR